jgi:hypothetical protein
MGQTSCQVFSKLVTLMPDGPSISKETVERNIALFDIRLPVCLSVSICLSHNNKNEIEVENQSLRSAARASFTAEFVGHAKSQLACLTQRLLWLLLFVRFLYNMLEAKLIRTRKNMVKLATLAINTLDCKKGKSPTSRIQNGHQRSFPPCVARHQGAG